MVSVDVPASVAPSRVASGIEQHAIGPELEEHIAASRAGAVYAGAVYEEVRLSQLARTSEGARVAAPVP